jgi:hypothetical protein
LATDAIGKIAGEGAIDVPDVREAIYTVEGIIFGAVLWR